MSTGIFIFSEKFFMARQLHPVILLQCELLALLLYYNANYSHLDLSTGACG